MSVSLATFAGGCFWCMQPPFDQLKGVLKTYPGYAGGHVENPSYEQICLGNTGHLEVIQINFDSEAISYEQLLSIFWKNIDPTDGQGQFVDRGPQYKTAIFYHDQEQKKLALKSIEEMNASGVFDMPIVTKVREIVNFYRAEDYHNAYYLKQQNNYQNYRAHSGRDQYILSKWKNNA